MQITRRNFFTSAAVLAAALAFKPDGHKTKYQDIRTEIDAFAKKLDQLAQRKALTNNSRSINEDDFMNLIDNLPLAKKAFLQFKKDYPKFIAKNPALDDDDGDVFRTFLKTYNIYLDTFYAEQA